MDDIEQKDVDLPNDENLDDVVEGDEPAEVPPKKEYTTEQKLARVERLRTKYLKEMGIEPEPKSKVEPAKLTPQETPSELDETQLDNLELRGITDDDDIAIIQSVMARTGQTLRQTLKDEYVKSKLASNKADRDVKAATPSSTRRGGAGPGDSFELALAKYEKTGELPSDFELRAKVIEAKENKEGDETPPWRK